MIKKTTRKIDKRKRKSASEERDYKQTSQPKGRRDAAHATGRFPLRSESRAGGRRRVPPRPSSTWEKARAPPAARAPAFTRPGSPDSLLFLSLCFSVVFFVSVRLCVSVAVFLCPLLDSVLMASLLLPSLSFPFNVSFPFLSSSHRPFIPFPSSSFSLYRSSETL